MCSILGSLQEITLLKRKNNMRTFIKSEKTRNPHKKDSLVNPEKTSSKIKFPLAYKKMNNFIKIKILLHKHFRKTKILSLIILTRSKNLTQGLLFYTTSSRAKQLRELSFHKKAESLTLCNTAKTIRFCYPLVMKKKFLFTILTKDILIQH